jgi:CHAT domain-containing protein
VVRGSSRVYIATDGWLAALPLETLVCPDDGDAPLLFHRDVVRVPSATLLRLQRARAPRPYGAGEFATVLAVASQSSELRGARRETNRLATRYGHVERPRALDRDAFIDAIARSDLVHVASHVRVDAERPWHSGILITRETPIPAEGSVVPARATTRGEDSLAVAAAVSTDPYARAAQIASARSDARLVVLSGCESALGRATQGEGVLGIAAAFFAAGARSVVASIWEVDDRVTAELMERFYESLAKGQPVASALRSAQIELQKRRPHPFYWAGFVVIGDGDVTVRLEPRSGLARFGVVALALAVVAGVFWVLMRGRLRV